MKIHIYLSIICTFLLFACPADRKNNEQIRDLYSYLNQKSEEGTISPVDGEDPLLEAWLYYLLLVEHRAKRGSPVVADERPVRLQRPLRHPWLRIGDPLFAVVCVRVIL